VIGYTSEEVNVKLRKRVKKKGYVKIKMSLGEYSTLMEVINEYENYTIANDPDFRNGHSKKVNKLLCDLIHSVRLK